VGEEKETPKAKNYHLIIPKVVQKDIQRLPVQVQELLLFRHLPVLQTNPHQGEFLKGKFRDLRKYAFRHLGTEYRIVYRVREDERMVILVMIGSREGFYERLRRRLG
jgi:addiction module RelE/StbE family toxin